MNNKPVAWMDKRTNKCVVFINTPPSDDWIPLYTQEQLEEARKLGMQQERALWELSAIGQEIDK